MPAHIVVVHDDPVFLDSITTALSAADHHVRTYSTALAAINALGEYSIDVLITRMRFPPGESNGLSLALIARRFNPIPRIMVDWDTSQADDFRTRRGPWTIKRTVLERGRAPRSDRKSLAQRRSAAGAGCRDSARRPQCSGYCVARIWKRCRAAWAYNGGDPERLA